MSVNPAFRRAFAASRQIPNAPDQERAKRIHAWAEFVQAALRDEDPATKNPPKRVICARDSGLIND